MIQKLVAFCTIWTRLMCTCLTSPGANDFVAKYQCSGRPARAAEEQKTVNNSAKPKTSATGSSQRGGPGGSAVERLSASCFGVSFFRFHTCARQRSKDRKIAAESIGECESVLPHLSVQFVRSPRGTHTYQKQNFEPRNHVEPKGIRGELLPRVATASVRRHHRRASWRHALRTASHA